MKNGLMEGEEYSQIIQLSVWSQFYNGVSV
jgi:hypothetical protein